MAREGGKELRDRGERELSVELRLNYKLFKCTNKHQVEVERTWSPGSFISMIGMSGTALASKCRSN